MQFTEERNIPGLLLMIDIKKAFDSVSWQFIDNTLICFFNFGPSIENGYLYISMKLYQLSHSQVFNHFS